MAQHRVSKLCQAVLPPGFERVKNRLPSIQRFLEENLPEPVNRCVTLLTLDSEEMVIAANSPAVASFLRMHSREIEQQLRETFKLNLRLRFRTVPDALLHVERTEIHREPRMPSADSAKAVRRNAEWIEDDNLREAMIALADSLKSEEN